MQPIKGMKRTNCWKPTRRVWFQKNDDSQECECGHSHVSYVGDLGEDQDEPGYQRINECDRCHCENYKKKRK